MNLLKTSVNNMDYKIITQGGCTEEMDSVYPCASSVFLSITKKFLPIAVFLFLFFPTGTFPQKINLEKKAQEITDEGKHLYKLEMAAWYGTDIFTENFKEQARIGGYFAYMDKDTPKCLFFSKGENPKVIGVVSFGDIKLIETATIDFKERNFKNNEKELYTIRTEALAQIRQDTLFKAYNNTSLNLIPTVYNGQRKVYVLTGPSNAGVVLFGNDYLITFDKQGNMADKKQIHRNLIPVNFNTEEKDDSKEVVATIHSHAAETGVFITPTDICTLMLYTKFAGWKQHIVISEKYVSIWDCINESLVIMTTEDYEKMRDEEKYG
jgi:hypothetical protein